MKINQEITTPVVLHWNYRGFTEFPLHRIAGDESEITDIYLKENLISHVPSDICKLQNLESLYLSGNDITVLPKEISRLKCLKCLDVSGNRLKRLPDEIGDLRSMKFLILDENELTELPNRVGELRYLRYLSVCDNRLRWLPQRPIYNYHHCEFRFWRNAGLRTIPYSLWYHMYRDQQTRSINIGCLNISSQNISENDTICLQLIRNSVTLNVDIPRPEQHNNIMKSDKYSTASLYELCKRKLYEIISKTAKRLCENIDYYTWQNKYNNDIIKDLQTFDKDNTIDENGNSTEVTLNTRNYEIEHKSKSYCTPSDVIGMHYRYLPYFIKSELCNGPISKCENVSCRRAVFDYAYYEFCVGKMILIDNVQDILLSAAFCSKACSNKWKTGKKVIPWSHKIDKKDVLVENIN